jgi:hypothetical protein
MSNRPNHQILIELARASIQREGNSIVRPFVLGNSIMNLDRASCRECVQADQHRREENRQVMPACHMKPDNRIQGGSGADFDAIERDGLEVISIEGQTAVYLFEVQYGRPAQQFAMHSIQRTSFLASGSLISTAFGSMIAPAALPFQWRSEGLESVPCMTIRVSRSTASVWPLYFLATSFHAGPNGITSCAPGFLGSTL